MSTLSVNTRPIHLVPGNRRALPITGNHRYKQWMRPSTTKLKRQRAMKPHIRMFKLAEELMRSENIVDSLIPNRTVLKLASINGKQLDTRDFQEDC